MASDESKRMVDLALSLLSANRPEDALDVLDKVGPESEASAEQLAYGGLAHAKLGNAKEALRLLRKAAELAPFDARMNYLLAMQLRASGQTEEAKNFAEAARLIDPKFPGLAELLPSVGIQPDPRLRLRERLLHPLPPPPDGPVHAFASIEQSDSLWTVMGWGMAVLNLVGLLLFRVHPPLHMPAKGAVQGISFLGGMMPNSDPLSVFTILLLIAAMILCFAWTVVDVVDRRSRFQWLVPLLPFCLCGAPGIALALYMALGRR